MNSIPPQAYTRDTLVKAIEWIGTQPQALRERASSADLLVSYYLQACRKAAVQMEAPVSQESFKADLRHLVEDLKQFDEPAAPPPQMPNRSHSFGPVEPLFSPPHLDIPLHGPAMEYHYVPPQPVAPAPAPAPTAAPAPAPAKSQGPQWSIDPKSLTIAREVQARLNLSNEGDAVRLLITLGAERARQLFP